MFDVIPILNHFFHNGVVTECLSFHIFEARYGRVRSEIIGTGIILVGLNHLRRKCRSHVINF